MLSLCHMPSTYTPGTCNIGKAEIRQRFRIGWAGLLVTVVSWIFFARFRLSAPWFALLFIPATLSALGFVQASSHFCVAFGMRGVFNVSEALRARESVEQAAFRAKDKRKAVRILLCSVLIGAAAAVSAYLLRAYAA